MKMMMMIPKLVSILLMLLGIGAIVSSAATTVGVAEDTITATTTTATTNSDIDSITNRNFKFLLRSGGVDNNNNNSNDEQHNEVLGSHHTVNDQRLNWKYDIGYIDTVPFTTSTSSSSSKTATTASSVSSTTTAESPALIDLSNLQFQTKTTSSSSTKSIVDIVIVQVQLSTKELFQSCMSRLSSLSSGPTTTTTSTTNTNNNNDNNDSDSNDEACYELLEHHYGIGTTTATVTVTAPSYNNNNDNNNNNNNNNKRSTYPYQLCCTDNALENGLCTKQQYGRLIVKGSSQGNLMKHFAVSVLSPFPFMSSSVSVSSSLSSSDELMESTPESDNSYIDDNYEYNENSLYDGIDYIDSFDNNNMIVPVQESGWYSTLYAYCGVGNTTATEQSYVTTIEMKGDTIYRSNPTTTTTTTSTNTSSMPSHLYVFKIISTVISALYMICCTVLLVLFFYTNKKNSIKTVITSLNITILSILFVGFLIGFLEILFYTIEMYNWDRTDGTRSILIREIGFVFGILKEGYTRWIALFAIVAVGTTGITKKAPPTTTTLSECNNNNITDSSNYHRTPTATTMIMNATYILCGIYIVSKIGADILTLMVISNHPEQYSIQSLNLLILLVEIVGIYLTYTIDAILIVLIVGTFYYNNKYNNHNSSLLWLYSILAIGSFTLFCACTDADNENVIRTEQQRWVRFIGYEVIYVLAWIGIATILLLSTPTSAQQQQHNDYDIMDDNTDPIATTGTTTSRLSRNSIATDPSLYEALIPSNHTNLVQNAQFDHVFDTDTDNEHGALCTIQIY